MNLRRRTLLALVLAAGVCRPCVAADPDPSKRMVLVELYTSQGCDMCPTAEEILGKLAAQDSRIVPVAFHVDYFNTPWRDVFSDPLYSRRQATYNEVYAGPKPESYGLYYTPMLMIDGERSVNGRDPAAAVAAIRAARSKPPGVRLDVDLDLAADELSGKVKIRVTRRSARVGKAPLLVCAVLREDGVATDVPSGENAGKTLVARFPARRTEYDDVELKDDLPAAKEFAFTIDPSWKRDKLRLAVFVQDKRTAAVHQAVDLPWKPAAPATGSPAASGR
ncbi:DUF1223 domain-containing protein [Paludisphaera mucosa]|uniref:DUF1223 domain-containing protein n=1 Tax=Paludisphaera mucosa TaxID=3030827 RepID=A0ABT6FC82_9BACT|nr:DUF1223 domain-containing protein [Paludisphaera mucosa]MDG3005059.1 DUF1223 domain-containing protein [Paludisphaera mucosa]